MTKSIAQKSPTGSLPPTVHPAITPTFSPWTHTSDDSYIYQLSLFLATATVSFTLIRYKNPNPARGRCLVVVLGKTLPVPGRYLCSDL